MNRLLEIPLLAFVLAGCSSTPPLLEGTRDEWVAAGRTALSEDRYLEGIRYLESAVRDHEEIELYYWLGWAYWRREDGPAAIQAYRAALKLDPVGQSDWSLYALENLAEVYTGADVGCDDSPTSRQSDAS